MNEQEGELLYFDQGADRQNKIMAVELGVEAQSFLQSRIGRALVEKAEYEKGSFLLALVDADPDDPVVNRKIRNEIKLRELGLNWILEMIGTGGIAENEIHEDPLPLKDPAPIQE
jgi:hypothetical protein